MYVARRLVEPDFVAAQIDAVFDDIRVDAVKIGMIGSAEIAEAVADALRRHKARHIVLDPVMVAKSGDRLLAADAVAALRDRLIPLAEMITPNLPEAAALPTPMSRATSRRMRAMAGKLLKLGPAAVLLKGGHLEGPTSVDVFLDDGSASSNCPRRASPRRTPTAPAARSSSAIAALLPDLPRREAVRRAKAYVSGAIAAADRLDVGSAKGRSIISHATEVPR